MLGDEITYFLFADKDIYFTKHLLKLDYERRIYQLLKEEDYEHIYFLEIANGQEMEIICETEASILEYQQKMKFIKPAILTDQNLGRTRYKMRQRDKDVRVMILRLIQSNPNDRYAFVLSRNTMARLCVNDLERRDFSEKIRAFRYAKGSIFLLTDDADVSGIMPDMPDIVLDYGQIQKINGMAGKLAKKIQSVAQSRVILWDIFEAEQLKRLLNRVYLSQRKYDTKQFDHQHRWLCTHFIEEHHNELLNMRVDSKETLFELLNEGNRFKQFARLVRDIGSIS